MHINDLASLEVLVIEMAHHELALGYIRQEFFFCNLGVLSMAFNQIFLLLLIHIFHLLHPSLTYVSHDLLLFITEFLVVLVFLVMVMPEKFMPLRDIVQVPFLVLQLLLDLDGLVLDRLLHDHVREDVCCHRLHC